MSTQTCSEVEATYQIVGQDDGSFEVVFITVSRTIKAGPFICRSDAEDWVEGHRTGGQIGSAFDAS